MHRVSAALITTLALSLSVWGSATAAPLNLNEIIKDETPEQLYDRLAGDPFDAFGPDEWGHPFSSVDYYRALPACSEALKAHPQEQRFALGIALADIAGGKRDAAKPVLEELIAKGNTSAMLALAYISPEAEAAKLMEQAAEAKAANAMMLYGMTLLTGKGVPKNEVEGVRMMRQAAEAGSTRAKLILANFYNQGVYGVGLDPREATRLISEAAKQGDPAARDLLAILEAAGTSGTTPQ
jgi:TPR repeat protein